jgi:hypothetical protein
MTKKKTEKAIFSKKLYSLFKSKFGIWAFVLLSFYVIVGSIQAFFTAIAYGLDIRDTFDNYIYGRVGIKEKSLKHTYANYKRHFR